MIVGKANFLGYISFRFFCRYLEVFSLKLYPCHQIFLELFLSSFSHLFFVVLKVLLAWIFQSNLTSFHVLPTYISLRVSHLLVVFQLCLLQFIFEQSRLMDFPAIFKSTNSCYQVGIDRFSSLQRLSFQCYRLRLQYAHMSMPKGPLPIIVLFYVKSAFFGY